MNRRAEQTNRTRTASRFTRFVCPALRFIPHEPRKKDTHSLIDIILELSDITLMVLVIDITLELSDITLMVLVIDIILELSDITLMVLVIEITLELSDITLMVYYT